MFSVLEKLDGEKLTASVQSSFPSIEQTALHIFAAEWLWLKRWTGIFPRASGPYTSSTLRNLLGSYGVPGEMLSGLPGMRNFCDSIEQERREFIRTLTEERLRAPLTFRDMAGMEYSERLVQLMQHVVNHGTYHRGQVTTLLRQAGAETVALDMLYFFRDEEQRAAAVAKP